MKKTITSYHMTSIGIACLCFASTLLAIPRKLLIEADMHQATNAVLSSLTEQQPIKKAEAWLLRWRKLILMDLHDGAARATINSFVLLLTNYFKGTPPAPTQSEQIKRRLKSNIRHLERSATKAEATRIFGNTSAYQASLLSEYVLPLIDALVTQQAQNESQS